MHYYPFSGTWAMWHDNWPGTLTIYPPDQELVAEDPPCTYTYMPFSGSYEPGGGGPALAVSGTIGGQDPNQQGHECPQSDHKIVFTIAFPGAPPQPFQGYIFTQAGPGRLAGYTWWAGLPFGWFAEKQS